MTSSRRDSFSLEFPNSLSQRVARISSVENIVRVGRKNKLFPASAVGLRVQSRARTRPPCFSRVCFFLRTLFSSRQALSTSHFSPQTGTTLQTVAPEDFPPGLPPVPPVADVRPSRFPPARPQVQFAVSRGLMAIDPPGRVWQWPPQAVAPVDVPTASTAGVFAPQWVAMV